MLKISYNIIKFNISRERSMILVFVLLIGIVVLVKPFAKLIISVCVHFKTLDLKERYRDGWAIITGATDGIGFGFCQVLASQGYNICLISRNAQKLNAKIQQLKAEFGNRVQFKAIKANFTQSHSQGFFQHIAKQLDTIKPVILINNVGISSITRLDEQKIQQMRDIISINCLPMVALSSYFINRCKKDKYKGGIVNVSSYASIMPVPFLAVYAATKAFNDTLSRACYIQEKNNIDILSVRPMKVISGSFKAQKSWTIPTSREFALASLKYLGYTDFTAGHLKHQVVTTMTQLIPRFLLKKIAAKESTKIYNQLKKKNE